MLILLVFYLAPIAQVGAVTQENRGLTINSAKVGNNSKEIKISADVVNNDAESTTFSVTIDPENSLTKEESATLKDTAGNEIGTYEVSGTQIAFTILPKVQASIDLSLALASDDLKEITLINDGKATTISLATSESSETTTTSKITTTSETTTTTTSSTEEKNEPDTSPSKVKQFKNNVKDSAPVDISTVLPDGANGTLIDSAEIGFTDQNGKPVDPTEAKVTKVSVENAEKTGSVVLTKTDSDTNKVLADAVFNLYKKDGTEVAEGLKTNAEGQMSYDNLKPGDYYFVETAAPAGYEFDKEKQYSFTVELQTTKKIAQVKVTNTKIPVKPDTNKTNNGQKLPNTGQKITSWTMVLGLFLIAFVAGVIVIRRKVN